MKRRSFLKGVIGITMGGMVPVNIFAGLPPVAVPVCVITTPTAGLTLLDMARRSTFDFDFVDVLSERNEILSDAEWVNWPRVPASKTNYGSA